MKRLWRYFMKRMFKQ